MPAHLASSRSAALLVAVLALGPGARVLAGPAGEQALTPGVEFAAPEVTPEGTTYRITAPDRAIIEYQSLDIAADERVEFIQPDAAARVLNRIVGPDGTEIQGALVGNGIVYLVNPAGVLFGADAVIDVGQLFAAAAQLSDADFAAGTDQFTGAAGDVENRGEIHAQAAHLIGLHVANLGAIHAPEGLITMTAGDDVLLTTSGSGIAVVVQGGAGDALAGVLQSGTLDAGASGQVRLGAGDAYALAINHPGQTDGGGAVLAAQSGEIRVEGRIGAGTEGISLGGASDVVLGDGALQSGAGVDVAASGAVRAVAADDDALAEISASGPVALVAGTSGVGNADASGPLEVDAAQVALDVSGDARVALLSGGSVSGSVGGDLEAAGTGDLTLGATDIGGDLDATASGALSDSDTVTVSGDASLTAGSLDADGLAVAGTLSVDVTGDAAVTNQGDLALGASNVGGNLDATALDGEIRDEGPVVVAGRASFTTRSDVVAGGPVGPPITLDEPGSSFGSVALRTLELGSDAVVEADVTLSQDADIVIESLQSAGIIEVDAGADHDVTLTQPVGSDVLLQALTVAARSVSLRDVATLRAQTYVSRGGGIQASGVYETFDGGAIVLDGPLSIADAVVLSTTGLGGRVELRGSVDGPGSLLVVIRSRDPLLIGGDVGASVSLDELRLIAPGDTRTGAADARTPGIQLGGTLVHADRILLGVPLDTGDGIRSSADRLLRPTIVGLGSSLTLRADSRLQLGRRERLVVPGSLRVEAPEAVLADLAALRIDVISPAITLLPRAAEFIELPELTAGGNQLTVRDLDVDVVANEIFFSSVPVVLGEGRPIFVTPLGDASATLDGFVRRLFRPDGRDLLLADLQRSARLFDQTGTGPGIDTDGSDLNLEAIFGELARALANSVRDLGADQGHLIGAGRVARIRQNRPLWSEEVLAFLQAPGRSGGWSAGSRLGLIGGGGGGLTLATDLGLPQVAAGGSDVNPDSSFALANDSARSALDLYGGLQKRDPQMRERLLAAWADFRASDGRQLRGEPASEFARWLRELPEQSDLVAHLKGYGHLIGLLEELYLTERESQRLKTELLEGLGAGELPVESVVRASI